MSNSLHLIILNIFICIIRNEMKFKRLKVFVRATSVMLALGLPFLYNNDEKLNKNIKLQII